MKKLILNQIQFQKYLFSTKKFVSSINEQQNSITNYNNLIKTKSNNNITNEKIDQNFSLMDRFARKHTYLRISLTEKCNLRCSFLNLRNLYYMTQKKNRTMKFCTHIKF